jgi:hypothetical protein
MYPELGTVTLRSIDNICKIEAVDPSSSLNFDVTLYIPVFSKTPGDIDFTLTSSGTVDITSNIVLFGRNAL